MHSLKLILKSFLLFTGILCFNITTKGQQRFKIDILPGFATVVPSKLKIEQEGYENISFKAKYNVESFKLPIYYSVRAGYALNEYISVEAELNHLKLYLANAPAEIQWFSISHGYNQLWFNVLKKKKNFDIRAGLGTVIAHPESTIRNQKLDENGGWGGKGYYVSGITSQVGIQKRIAIGKYFFLSGETKMNISRGKVKVATGHARVSVFAWHALLGIGLNL